MQEGHPWKAMRPQQSAYIKATFSNGKVNIRNKTYSNKAGLI